MSNKTKKAAVVGALGLLLLMGAQKPKKKKKGGNGDGTNGDGHDPYDPYDPTPDDGYDPSGPPGPGPDDGGGDGGVNPTPTPIQGAYYTIKGGDWLTKIAQSAGASSNLTAAKIINAHPLNAGLLIVPKLDSQEAFNKNHFGTIISFYKDWRAHPSTDAERFQGGNSFATIYIPFFG